jgi:hypothetical protein
VPDDEGRQEPPHGASPAADGPPAPPDPPNLSPWSSPAPDAGPSAETAPYGTPPGPPDGPPPAEGSPYAAPADQPYGPPPGQGSPYAAPADQPYGPPPGASYGPPPGQVAGPGYGPPPPYGAPPAYGPPPGYGPAGYGYGGPRTSSNATVVLACGIGSLFLLFTCGLGFIPAIVALVRAGAARREILASEGRLTGLGMVQAGRITAWITIGLTILAIIAVVALVVLGVAFDSGSGGFSDGGFSATAR